MQPSKTNPKQEISRFWQNSTFFFSELTKFSFVFEALAPGKKNEMEVLGTESKDTNQNFWTL